MLRIYNTLTRKIEDFEPINKERVNMYVCGPTVYSDIHIGNARPVIFFDMLRKYLKHLKYDVFYVSNITDIDDKIIEEAKNKNISEEELTNYYTEAFINASLSVGSELPEFMPKATDYIDNIITYIENLIDKGYAYKTNSGVYFSTTKIKNYGDLSKQRNEELLESVRIENKSDKLDFRDFTLWKLTEEGLNYDSPWGKGRPGWHTECAVMNDEVFDGMIDIHGGGSDLIFPHHENEIAQTIAHSDHTLSKYWMHVGRVNMGSEKMSKSIGNTILVKDLNNPISYRLLILSHHYRAPINFSNEMLIEFDEMYDRIIRTIKRAKLKLVETENNDSINTEIINEFEKEMNNDLNTPNVTTLILEIVKLINKENDLVELFKLVNTLELILEVFSLNPNIKADETVLTKFENWEKARKEKDFTLADKLRDELVEEGWI